MTVLDKNLQFSDSQALTVTADSTNHYDATTDRDIGPGEPLAMVIYFETVLGGTSTPTIKIGIETDDNNSFSSGTVISESQVVAAADIAVGDKVVIPLPMENERFIQLIYTLTGTSPTMTLSSYLMPLSSVTNQRYLPNNYTITS